jgi:hemerythrin HHE cation binding domain-containing protein
MSRILDAAAEDAGRDPAQVRRAFNISGRFTATGAGFLQGPPARWAEQLTALVLEHGMSTFLLGPGGDPATDLRRFAEEVAPAVREAVEQARATPHATPVDTAGRPRSGSATLPLRGAEPGAGSPGAQTLLAVHEHLRQELDQLREVMGQVARGRASAASARSHLHQMTMRQNYWTFGAFCAAYCRVVTVHHAIEDAHLFRDLRRADPSLGPVLDRLADEHQAIAAHITDLDAALVAMIDDPARLDDAEAAVDRLADALLPHLRVEEDQLLDPIDRLGIRV